MIGRLIADKFQLRGMLADGGMGRIYLANHLALNVEICVKTLHPELRSDAAVVKRFFREAQAASRVRHPNCVQVIDFGETTDGVTYVAMERVRGRPLSEVLTSDGPLAPARAIRIATQICDVLEATHRQGLVHRDLKPSNIMLEDLPSHREFVKILDFGVAKFPGDGEDEARLVASGMVLGTPAYMAPEQALAEEVDHRADIYSLGVILYEMLCGRLPFESERPEVVVACHANVPAPPLRERRPEVPVAVADVVDRCLEKQRELRPSTAIEMRRDLERALSAAEQTERRKVERTVRELGTFPRARRGAAPALTPGFGVPSISGVMNPSGTGPAAAPMLRCPACARQNPVGAKFCMECGAAVRGGPRR